MKKALIEVKFLSTPNIIEYCKKCGRKMEYKSSGKFRVNANGKILDIWLVYKCIDCNNTLNIELFSRMNRNGFKDFVLEKFLRNDETLAEKYAFDISCGIFGKKESTIPDYEIVGNCNLGAINEPLEIIIESQYQTRIKIAGIIKKGLSLSNLELENLIKNGLILCSTNSNLKKCFLQNEQKITINY